ncbi:aminotransferase class I/II-fold pyridoxal phosphate-dependent enzyme [Cohnella sp. CFH 77786]|uniref:MocR-like pyridoxine biosynthesis transcription factor PdxR n=1 Tax=Cohnella sp. CFH 77786 TaxID=2662265 RepID=UPI001C60BFAC|nr:PLP-dependent aminotransferase family protein [Cohnella sp. CFH 77786]MBW5446075.1 aminotransferase class I/II-fold pyridoxal phosphate-dependent enzyme [Cohnella sp. CFH 77786]
MISLTPDLDKQNKSPLYHQLYAYIRRQIEGGVLRENERLPSIRQLASHLNVSKNTVETAYQQLMAEGYIQSRLRSGIQVLPMEKLTLGGSGITSGAEPERGEHEGARRDEPDAIDFEYGDVDRERFPVKAWKKCLADALNDRFDEVYGYGERQGHFGLRNEIARYLYQSRGVVCSPGRIFLSAGTQQSVSLLCQLLPLADRVAMEEPGYNGVRAVFANHGREIVPIPLDEDGLRVDRLRMCGAKAVYVTPSHQFPSGIVMPVRRRAQLLQWAYESGGFILEDDYDSEFRYQGQPIPALKAMDAGDRVIYLGTFSKSFLPGARLSYMVLPESLARVYERQMQPYSQAVSPLIQTAVYLFMRGGGFEGHVRKMRTLYQSRHRTLIRSIQEYFGGRVGIIGQKSGIHLILDVYGRSAPELIDLASRHGVKVYSPAIHWTDPAQCPESYVLLGFAGVNEERIGEGIIRLRRAWFE